LDAAASLLEAFIGSFEVHERLEDKLLDLLTP
jgi:hypothetical protein